MRPEGVQVVIMKRRLPNISSQLNRRLIIVMLVMFLLTSAFFVVIQYNNALKEAERILENAINDEINSISGVFDENYMMFVDMFNYAIKEDVGNNIEVNLDNYKSDQTCREINIIDENGIITDSTDKNIIGYDLMSNEISAEFFEQLKERGRAFTPIRQGVNDPDTILKYIGVALDTGGYVQVGFDRRNVDLSIADMIQTITINRHILDNGLLFIVDEKNRAAGLSSGRINDALKNKLESIDYHGATGVIRCISFGGETYYCMYDIIASYKIVAVLPQEDVFRNIRISIIMSVILGVVLFLTLYFSVSLLVRHKVVRQVNEIAQTLGRITDGNLNAQVSVRSSREFNTISEGINATVNSLKEHIAREASRIDEELGYARQIQHSVLPALTDAFRDNRSFGLYASMDTAKEVGGDFYDFYMANENTLVFMIADVSGKGIPAAMFMMNGKATLHDCISDTGDLGSVISYANKRICEGNEAGMFITAWIGVLDIRTGEVRFVNAGHNPPAIIRGGRAGFMEMEADLILGLMDDEQYRTQSLKLVKGDILFLYTDGVTEAVSTDKKLYGGERLTECLSGMSAGEGNICADVCRRVAQSVELFADGAPQADDITMLCLHYKGTE